MQKKGKLPALVQLAIATLITSVLWIGFEIYRTIETEPEPDVSPQVLQQLDPTLDQVMLDRLVNRITLDDAEIGDTVLIDSVGQQTVIDDEVETDESQDEIDEDTEPIEIPEEESDTNQATESAQN